MKRRRQNLPKSNSGAIADVSFLLLIFFMVVTTFNKDYKLTMTLPPYTPDKVSGPVPSNRLVQLLLNAENELMIQDEPVGEESTDLLTEKLSKIIKQGLEPIVIIKMHPNTSYQYYIELLAEINAAKNNVRTDLAQENFKKEFAELNINQQKSIEQKVKIKISEQEMKL